MGKDRGFIILDPLKDKTLIHIFNDMKINQTINFPYNGREEKEKWILTSRKIGIKCKKLINITPPLLWGTSTSRSKSTGYIHKPPNVDVEIIPFKGKQKVIFTRKIF